MYKNFIAVVQYLPYNIIDDFLLRLLTFDTRTTPRPANQMGQQHINNRRYK